MTMPANRANGVAKFGAFELDLASGELRKAGARIRLEGQPLQILTMLVRRAGEPVSREEIREALWQSDTFVDFERNLNSAVKRLRTALGDSGHTPRFVERLPKRGYRLIAPVVWRDEAGASVRAPEGHARDVTTPPEVEPSGRAMPPTPPSMLSARPGRRGPAILVAIVAVIAMLGYGWARWTIERTRRAIRSIAVMPLETAAISGGDATTYVAFGLTDALTTELSKLDGLRVASATSARWSRQTGRSLPDIARLLDVDAVVEGSVVQEDSRVRVTVQLIDVATDSHLWAETYTREGSSLLNLQTEIAQAVAREVRLTLAPERGESIPMTPIVDPVAERAYLEGRYHASRGTAEGWTRAREAFERALAKRPKHAAAHAGLADVYALSDEWPPSKALPKAREHAMKALAIDPKLARTHATLGFIAYYADWDWAGAERSLAHALDLDPGDVRSIRWYGRVIGALGRTTEALSHVGRAVQIDPIELASLDSLAMEEFRAREFERSLETAGRLLDLDPHDSRGHEHLAAGSALLGRFEECLSAVARATSLVGPAPSLLAIDTYCLGRLGRTGEAERRLAELGTLGKRRYVPPYFHAIAALGLDRRDEAVGWLERGHRDRDPYMVELKTSPWLDPVRSDPRVQKLLRLMAFPE